MTTNQPPAGNWKVSPETLRWVNQQCLNLELGQRDFAETLRNLYESQGRSASRGIDTSTYPIPKHRDSTVSPKDQRYFDLLKIVLEHGPKDLYARVVIGALDAFEKTWELDTLRAGGSAEGDSGLEEKRGPGSAGKPTSAGKRGNRPPGA